MSDETQINVEKIRTDGGTQPRAAINEEAVTDFAERIAAGDKFPPIVVFYDGSDYWLADGFHRVLAHRAAGRKRVLAEVHQGDRRAAILHSVGVNATHGLRRTNADKRRAVMTLLKDAEWAAWSDREIARRCLVNQSTVSRLRPDVTDAKHQSDTRTYTTKHGTTATMQTGGINADRPKREPADPDELVEWPQASPAEKRSQQDESHRFFQVFRAMEALATCDLHPKKFADECPETSAYRVDQHIKAAVEWLTLLDQYWGEEE